MSQESKPNSLKLKGQYVLMISKWYPYDKDLQYGVFVQKQAEAIAGFRDIVVYSCHAYSEKRNENFNLDIKRKGRLTEYTMYYQKNKSMLAPFINAILYFKAWLKAKNIILSNHGKPEILHAYILLRPAVLAFFYSYLYNIPYVISEQWSGYTNGKFNERSGLTRYISKYIFKKAAARISVSEFLKESLENLGFENQIHVIPNVIEIQEARPITIKKHIKILVVADLVDEIKNISGTIKAFAKVKQSIPNIRLEIIGHGKDEQKLKKLATELHLDADSISFEGLKNNAEVYESLWECDFLVLNSRFETFSLICAEALSCGKPVIATKCGGPQEFINESNGILIPVNEPSSLESAIENMSQNYMNYSSQEIRAEVIKKFSAETVGRKFKELYSVVL